MPICPRCNETVAPADDQMLDDGAVTHKVCFDRKKRMAARRLLLITVEKEPLQISPKHRFGPLPPAA